LVVKRKSTAAAQMFNGVPLACYQSFVFHVHYLSYS
jgi:hypothetical protein